MSNAHGLASCITAIAISLSLGSGCHSGDTDGEGGGGGSGLSGSGTSTSASMSLASSTTSSSATGSSAGSGGASGDPNVLAEGRVGLAAVRVAGDRVVWTESGSGSNSGGVLSCSVGGCPSGPTPIASAQPAPLALIVDATSAYWTDLETQGAFTCPLDGECATPMPLITSSQRLWDIAIDDGSIYFSYGDDAYLGSINTCSFPGCDVADAAALADDQPHPRTVVVSEGDIFWSNGGSAPEFTDGLLHTCPTSGCIGPPTVIAPQQTRIQDIAVDATTIYWSVLGLDESEGAIYACPRTGCFGDITLIAGPLHQPLAIAVDDSRVYFTEVGVPLMTGGKISSCPKTGCRGEPVVHATDQGGPRDIATDATSIYWINLFDGRVMRASK